MRRSRGEPPQASALEALGHGLTQGDALGGGFGRQALANLHRLAHLLKVQLLVVPAETPMIPDTQ